MIVIKVDNHLFILNLFLSSIQALAKIYNSSILEVYRKHSSLTYSDLLAIFA